MIAPGLSTFLRAARRKTGDPVAIFETATEYLSAKQVSKLVSALRETHGWRLPKRDRDPLIDDLLAAGAKPVRIADDLGCDRKTVYRRAQVVAEGGEPPPVHGLNKRCQCPKTAVRIPVHPPAYLDATSGANLEAEREFFRRLKAGS